MGAAQGGMAGTVMAAWLWLMGSGQRVGGPAPSQGQSYSGARLGANFAVSIPHPRRRKRGTCGPDHRCVHMRVCVHVCGANVCVHTGVSAYKV